MNTEIRNRLRAEMSARRGALGAAARIAAAEGVARSLEQLPEFMVDPAVAGYWAVRGELPLNLVVASLRGRDQHYYLPILDDSTPRALRFAEYRIGDPLKTNRFGIPEPRGASVGAREMDVVLLPLLAFDACGNRLGAGGGFYDTTFSFLRERAGTAKPLLVGVGYAFQQTAALPTEAWDVPLDYLATEKELIDCAEARAA
ncbi:MAG TPA: 5-formyltetrahydrofolate cyclo-ligase [Rhodanobacteraceae bacterium]|nr:5-formyltetrahydrofolate cyclo-ligase [Rhodanobacteraceae bacterium]